MFVRARPSGGPNKLAEMKWFCCFMYSVVTDLKVLPDCEFQSFYAQDRKEGYQHVKMSNVYPSDDTLQKNYKKIEKANILVDAKVRRCSQALR